MNDVMSGIALQAERNKVRYVIGSEMKGVVFSPSGDHLLFYTSEGGISIYHIPSQSLHVRLWDHPSKIIGVGFLSEEEICILTTVNMICAPLEMWHGSGVPREVPLEYSYQVGYIDGNSVWLCDYRRYAVWEGGERREGRIVGLEEGDEVVQLLCRDKNVFMKVRRGKEGLLMRLALGEGELALKEVVESKGDIQAMTISSDKEWLGLLYRYNNGKVSMSEVIYYHIYSHAKVKKYSVQGIGHHLCFEPVGLDVYLCVGLTGGKDGIIKIYYDHPNPKYVIHKQSKLVRGMVSRGNALFLFTFDQQCLVTTLSTFKTLFTFPLFPSSLDHLYLTHDGVACI